LLSQPEELRAAGIKIAFGSFDNSFARRLGQNAANAIAHGLPLRRRAQGGHALSCANVWPRRATGTVETGKTANLIVTNGDPLEVTTDIRYLLIKGQLTSTDNKQKALYEKYLGRPKAAR